MENRIIRQQVGSLEVSRIYRLAESKQSCIRDVRGFEPPDFGMPRVGCLLHYIIYCVTSEIHLCALGVTGTSCKYGLKYVFEESTFAVNLCMSN
jgi:hypothetical protein